MKKETKKMLESMGFKLMAYTLWKHEGLGVMISFKDTDTPQDIAVKLFTSGEGHKVAEFRKLLNII